LKHTTRTLANGITLSSTQMMSLFMTTAAGPSRDDIYQAAGCQPVSSQWSDLLLLRVRPGL
jgi:hypothetical protein